MHHDDHDHDHPTDGVIPNWRPTELPLTTPYGHSGPEDTLEYVTERGGVLRGGKRPEPKDCPKSPEERFHSFVGQVAKKLEEYNVALDKWRATQKYHDEALQRYQRLVEEFNALASSQHLVDTSEEAGFMLEVVTVSGFATQVRIMAHPIHDGKPVQDPVRLMYNHSRSFLSIIPPVSS